MWAWGNNNSGQLGDGTTTNRTTPVQVVGLANVLTVATSGLFCAYCTTGSTYFDSHTAALKTDGTVWTWGGNSHGQLGDGTTTNRTTPVQVVGLTGVIAVSAGYQLTIALKSDGTVWAWGSNLWGSLGENSADPDYGFHDSSTPVQVYGLANVIAISAGDFANAALKSDGTVWTWGGGGEWDKLTPWQVGGLTNVTAIADVGGNQHFIALKRDGTVWMWIKGVYWNGTPEQVNGLTWITSIAGANFNSHAFAVKNDGTVWTWSVHLDIPQEAPVQVQGITDAISVSAGHTHAVAVRISCSCN